LPIVTSHFQDGEQSLIRKSLYRQ